jgi:ABC-2 type transport system ATP-binding protein
MALVIETKGLSKWFGEVVALNNLDVEVAEGVTGMLGPNGAGKSTFIKLCLGLLGPSRGTLKVLGGEPRNNPDVLRRIGYCPEIDHFYDNMTGFEFVYWLNRHYGMTAAGAEKAAEEACETVRLTDRMDDPIDSYSKGMRQRIKIAQALALKPELLFLDEPMAGLDPRGREEMFKLIRNLGDAGISVVVSSHILYEVEQVTDNVVLIYNGTVLAHGRIAEIRDMLDHHPRTIEITSADPRALSQAFIAHPETLSLEYSEDTLILRTSNPNATYQHLNEIARDHPDAVRAMTCSDDNLQSVFKYLIK